MANTKQAKKMIRKIKTRTTRNRRLKTKVKLAIKEIDNLIASNAKAEEVSLAKSHLQKAVDKASKNGVIHTNKASRIKSRFNKKSEVKKS